MKGIKIIALAITSVILSRCVGDDITIEDEKYTRPINIAAPVAIIESSCEDMFNKMSSNETNTKFNINDEGLLYVTYNKEYVYTWVDILKLSELKCKINERINVKNELIKKRIIGKCKLNTIKDQRLDSIFIKAATMNFNAKGMDASGKAILTIPELRNTKGEVFTVNWPLESGYNLKEGADGFTIFPTNENDSCYMTFNIDIEGRKLGSNTTMNFNFEMADFVPKQVYGYFGNYTMCNERYWDDFEIFDDGSVPMEIEIKGCKVNMDINNYAGCQFNVMLDDMNYINEDDDITKQLHFLSSNILFVEQKNIKEFIKNSNIEPEHNYYQLDSTNSNINEVFNIHPNKSNYILNIVTNPHGENQTNYITEDKKLLANVEEYIPLWVRINKLERKDTIDFDLKDIFDDDNINYVDEATLGFKIDNGLPAKLYAQGYYITENGKIIDSLYSEPKLICKSPEFDSNYYRIKGWSYNEENVTLTHDQMQQYYDQKVNKMLFKTYVTTKDYGERFVKCFKDYGLKIKCTIDVKSKARD